MMFPKPKFTLTGKQNSHTTPPGGTKGYIRSSSSMNRHKPSPYLRVGSLRKLLLFGLAVLGFSINISEATIAKVNPGTNNVTIHIQPCTTCKGTGCATKDDHECLLRVNSCYDSDSDSVEFFPVGDTICLKCMGTTCTKYKQKSDGSGWTCSCRTHFFNNKHKCTDCTKGRVPNIQSNLTLCPCRECADCSGQSANMSWRRDDQNDFHRESITVPQNAQIMFSIEGVTCSDEGRYWVSSSEGGCWHSGEPAVEEKDRFIKKDKEFILYKSNTLCRHMIQVGKTCTKCEGGTAGKGTLSPRGKISINVEDPAHILNPMKHQYSRPSNQIYFPDDKQSTEGRGFRDYGSIDVYPEAQQNCSNQYHEEDMQRPERFYTIGTGAAPKMNYGMVLVRLKGLLSEWGVNQIDLVALKRLVQHYDIQARPDLKDIEDAFKKMDFFGSKKLDITIYLSGHS